MMASVPSATNEDSDAVKKLQEDDVYNKIL